MHYIRFLKTAKLVLTDTGVPSKITATISITTDLGENFFPEQVHIEIKVIDGSFSSTLADSNRSETFIPKNSAVLEQHQGEKKNQFEKPAREAVYADVQKEVGPVLEDGEPLKKKRKKSEGPIRSDTDEGFRIISTQIIKWKGNGQRALPIEIPLPRGQEAKERPEGYQSSHNFVLQLNVKDTQMVSISMQSSEAGVEQPNPILVMPLLIPVSMRVMPNSNSSNTFKLPSIYTKRFLDFSRGTLKPENYLDYSSGFSIVEETGDSIARHTWDAGLALIANLSTLPSITQNITSLAVGLEPDQRKSCSRALEADSLQTCSNGRIPSLDALLVEHAKDQGARLRILELGAGTGTVGLWFKKKYIDAIVLLTDLPDAEEIASANIQALSLSTVATQPDDTETKHNQVLEGLEFHALDWENPVLPSKYGSIQWDLIIASDCIYNTDSIPLLVNTFSILCKQSPESRFLVATKTRHDSEVVFFDLVKKAGFKIIEKAMVLAPMDTLPKDDATYQEIHIYLLNSNVS